MKEKGVGANSALLEHFSGLSSGQAGAGSKLLAQLLTGNLQTEDDLKYSLNRLIKGTASNRQIAREGYYSALCVLLKARNDISITQILEILNKELQISGQSKGEIGELCTGHVLVCGAVLRSGLFGRAAEDEQSSLISMLFTATAKRSYLSLLTHTFLSDFIIQSPDSEIFKLWPHIKKSYDKPLKEQSLDSLYLLITLLDKCPSLANKFFVKKLKIPQLICEETIADISAIVMNVPEFAYINHPVYESLARFLAKSECLASFWTDGLENNMGLQKENRVLVVLTVLGAILNNLGDRIDVVPSLLSDRFIPCILEWFKGFQIASQTGKPIRLNKNSKVKIHENKGKQIVVKAKEVFDNLIDVLKKAAKPQITLEVIKKLLFTPGDIMFCDITNTRVVKLLIEELDAESVRDFAQILKKVVTNETKKSHSDGSERFWTNSERCRAADMLTYLINHRTTSDDLKWRTQHMEFLIQISLFRSTGHEETHVSSELSSSVKKCFFRCLTHRLSKLEVLLSILKSSVRFIDERLDDDAKFAPNVIEAWKSTVEFTTMLDRSEESKACIVFQILALHCGLFLFSDVMTLETAVNSLKEIKSCYEHHSNDNKASAEHNEGDIVDDEPEWTEVLTDIFLSFLSRDSYLLRNIVQCVFRLLSDYVTPSAIGQILSVLDPDDDSNLMSYRDESDSESEDEPEEAEEAHESTESEEEEDDEMTVNDQFRLAVQKALGNAAPDTDTESIDIDNLDEDEGQRIDTALAGAFKMLKQSKGELTKKDKKDMRSLMEFRIRTLDLLNIYLEKSPSMDICLGMISPLFKCLEFAVKEAAQKQLEDKVRKTIKSLTDIRTFSSIEGVTVDVLVDYLKAITDRGSRTQYVFQALGDVISKCSSFIIRCSQRLNLKKKKTLQLVNIYKEYLEAFFTKRDCLLPIIFFYDVLQIKWDGNWPLLQVIIEKIFDENVRQFRKNEGLEMIGLFYQNLKRNLKAGQPMDVSRLGDVEKLFSDNIVAYLQSNSPGNDRFFTVLLKILIIVKNYHDSGDEQCEMAWSELAETIQNARKTIKLKNVQKYFEFCNLFKLEKIKNNAVAAKIVEKKEMVDSGHDSDTDGDIKARVNGDAESTNRKKQKKNVSKKEAKHLRMMASSQGFQDISFTALVNSSNVNIDEIVEEPEISDVKKSKRKLKDEEHERRLNKKLKGN